MENKKIEATWSPPKNVIIVGGSLSGLMHGLMLHRRGSHVRILEQSTSDQPVSHMAGVCLGVDVQQLLKRCDAHSDIPLGIQCNQLQSIDAQGKVHPFLKVNRIMSSWDALYFRLRANFDLRASDFIPQPLPHLNTDAAGQSGIEESINDSASRAKYEVGKEVVGLEQTDGGQVMVRYKDHADGGKDEQSLADLVIAADGPNSAVRKMLLGPDQAERKYAGYVAWRGAVLENQVSEETRQTFRENITYSIMKGEGGHVILYNIPGPGGSVEPGERFLNFCWYVNVTADNLPEIMTDVDGKRHHTKVSPGKVHPQVWAKQKAIGRRLLAAPYLEVLDKIESPFLHLITDYTCPRASFAGGKVLVVGDAATLLRPHIAFSTNQAACHALLTDRLVTGDVTAEEWEYQVTTAGHLHWRRSVWFGDFFQQPWYVSASSALLFWVTSALARVRVWRGWLPPQAT